MLPLCHRGPFENSQNPDISDILEQKNRNWNLRQKIAVGSAVRARTLWLNEAEKLANLISKLNFYKLIPYPMDKCFTGRRDRSRQTPEKDILYIILAGPVMECAFAGWRIVLPSCLDRLQLPVLKQVQREVSYGI